MIRYIYLVVVVLVYRPDVLALDVGALLCYLPEVLLGVVADRGVALPPGGAALAAQRRPRRPQYICHHKFGHYYRHVSSPYLIAIYNLYRLNCCQIGHHNIGEKGKNVEQLEF